MYIVPSSLTLLTYAPASPIKPEAIDLALSGVIFEVLDPPPDPLPEPEPDPLPEPEPDPLPPELVPPPAPLFPELDPEEPSEPAPPLASVPNISFKPLLSELELSGENPVKSLKTALSPSLIPYAVTPAAIPPPLLEDINL